MLLVDASLARAIHAVRGVPGALVPRRAVGRWLVVGWVRGLRVAVRGLPGRGLVAVVVEVGKPRVAVVDAPVIVVDA